MSSNWGYNPIMDKNEKPCTYVMWARGTDLNDDFFSACAPVQGSGHDVASEPAFVSGFPRQDAEPKNMAVVHKPIDEVRRIAETSGQKGLVLEPGFYT